MDGEISSRINKIYSEYYSDKAKRRHTYLSQVSKRFLEHLDLEKIDGHKVVCELSDIRLRGIVNSYFLDVIRYKEGHFEPIGFEPYSQEWVEAIHKHKFISQSKVAAFSVKWILKYAPIYLEFSPSNVKLDRLATSVNAMLALSVSLDVFGMGPQDLSERDIEHFLYHFKYRNYEEKSFFLVFDRWVESDD